MISAAAQDRPDEVLRSILIVGGGTAGWMAAAALAGRLEKLGITITLVEAPDIRTVGVGEATVPGIRDFFRDLGISESAVLAATNGTIKLGIEFEDWSKPGHRFFHPFGLYGSRSRGVAFHQYWLKRRAAGDDHPLDDYALCTALARANRFLPPPEKPAGDWAFFNYAVHFDASLYAGMLRDYAIARGVRHVEGRIADVRTGERDHIAGVDLADGRQIDADFFIDCSGFRALLIGGALGVDYVDWTDMLPCDRAVALPCAHGGGPLTPYTRSTALEAGWAWRIPLQNRVGNGYVYASRHLSDDEAVATLRGRLEGEALAEPNLLRFTTGHRRRFWLGNCLSLGLAAGFVEPLESTSITVIQTGIERLIELFPDRRCDPALADEFNRTTTLEYERIRDFLLLHYWGNGRHGEPLWDGCRALDLPEPLAHKIRLFRARGKLVRYQWEAFQDPSWLSLYAGFGMLPDRHDPLADHFTDEELGGAFARMRAAIAQAVESAPPHAAFLERQSRAA